MEEISTESSVKDFYDKSGWKTSQEGTTVDAQLWEDLRPCAQDYVSACRRKILKHIPQIGERLLDAASGPIQYPEYLEYSEGYKKRVCVDISEKALQEAQKKIGSKGEALLTSILDLPFPDNHFDATVSLHTIYHIDAKDQERAVLQLLRVTKPENPVVIVYSNPNRLLARLRRLVSKNTLNNDAQIYFHSYSLEWWRRFEKQADVEILPWRSLTALDAHRLVPDNVMGKLFLKILLKIEENFLSLMAHWGAYPMIILKKKV